jgi:hypothetical protein
MILQRKLQGAIYYDLYLTVYYCNRPRSVSKLWASCRDVLGAGGSGRPGGSIGIYSGVNQLAYRGVSGSVFYFDDNLKLISLIT